MVGDGGAGGYFGVGVVDALFEAGYGDADGGDAGVFVDFGAVVGVDGHVGAPPVDVDGADGGAGTNVGFGDGYVGGVGEFGGDGGAGDEVDGGVFPDHGDVVNELSFLGFGHDGEALGGQFNVGVVFDPGEGA